MSQILTMRAAIVTRLRTVFPGVNVEEHPRAEFTTKDLDAARRKGHLVMRVMFRGVFEGDTKMSSHECDVPQSWGIVVASKDGRGSSTDDLARDVKILRVLPDLLRTVASNGWDVGDIVMTEPRRILCNEMYAGDEDGGAQSAMAWGVTWVQTASIPPVETDDLRDFLTLVTRYDLAPGDEAYEASDTIDLPQDP